MTLSIHHASPSHVPDLLQRWWPAAVLLLVVALVYWPGRGGGFVFDDFPNLVDNTALHVVTLDWRAWLSAAFSSPASAVQRPLAMLSFAVNHYFTGIDPMPMKLTNIAIHLLNTLLVLGLMRRALSMAPLSTAIDAQRREWAARFVAAAWALHPINLMAVLYAVQRMESLSHTFVFAGLWLYLLGRQRQLAGNAGWGLVFAGLGGGTALGILSKESAVLLPLYAFCLELCLLDFRGRGERTGRQLRVLYACVLFVPALLGLAWLWPKVSTAGAFTARHFSLGERLLTEPRVVLDYLRWILLPDLGQLSLYHDDYPVSRGLLQPATTLPALLAVPVLLGVAWWLRTRRPLAALGLLWFFGAHVLTATIIPFELVFEHRNYFASLGICLLVADMLLLAPRTESGRRVGVMVAIVAIAGFAGITFLRASEWRDPARFAITEAAKHPQSPRATYDQARVMVVLTGYRSDSPLLPKAQEALEQARQAPGSGVLPLQASLLLAARTGTPIDPAWWSQLQQLLRRGPIGPQEVNALQALTHCARARDCVFPRDQVLASYHAALNHGPNPDVLTMQGDYALNVLGDRATALRLWREVSAAHPTVAQYRINLIKLLIANGDGDEARAQIAALRQLGRLRQHETVAAQLEARLEAAMPNTPQ